MNKERQIVVDDRQQRNRLDLVSEINTIICKIPNVGHVVDPSLGLLIDQDHLFVETM